ncbi:hypothetical protein J32TS6_19950 [Virgibacillus pantothenticus]|nr:MULTISPECIES: hypothetical protein [Virgibacillus]API92783.1 hypothetical protein BKP57_13790 [Virgibacillus sp. 6R]MBS7428290.1 hypothetical protein [Virgibacillus sp. 19R1-5]GIP63440.1 hypothetical protein J32TS6_19950 [Virgibacillus pantothenticus]
MSINDVSLSSIVWKQYQYKQKSYVGIYVSLMVLQLISVLFGIDGSVFFTGGGMDNFNFYMNYFSSDMAIIFTVIWGGISAALITTKGYWLENFMFVTNRLSNHLSNITFLVSISIIGGITALLTKYVNVSIHYILGRDPLIRMSNLGGHEILAGIIATVLYILFACAIGYLYGIILKMNRLIAILIPVLLIGFGIVGNNDGELYGAVFSYFFQENSIILFMIKVIGAIGILFSFAILLSNKKEELR